MTISLSLNNPTFTLRDKIQEISNDFLNQYDLSYFQYLRCYSDGSVGLLTNDTRLAECFQHVDDSPVVFSSFGEEEQNAHSYWFLWNESLPEYPVQLASQKFNIRHGITLVKRHKNHYDMIAVGVSQTLDNPGSFYLNKLNAIGQYFYQFEQDNKELIQLMDDNPIVLPQAYRDANYEKICLSNGRLNFAGNKGMTYVTTQELSCLRELMQGMTYKQIAQNLQISPRTVETYLQRIKERTGFKTIDDVLSLLK